MRALHLSTKDEQDIEKFKTIVSKPTININDINEWAGTVANPIVCSPKNIKLNAKGGLSVRCLTEVLSPVYKCERTKVLGDVQPKKRVKKVASTSEIDPKIIKIATAIAKILKVV